jgi:hypothetical protein
VLTDRTGQHHIVMERGAAARSVSVGPVEHAPQDRRNLSKCTGL